MWMARRRCIGGSRRTGVAGKWWPRRVSVLLCTRAVCNDARRSPLQVLNKAVKELPTEPVLHIIAAKLQEAQGTNPVMVRRIISRAIKDKLPKAGVIIDRETWLREAETAEKAVPPMVTTCRAIVKEVVDVAVDEHDRKDTYHRDAAEAADRGCVETARAILEHACESFPASETSWRAAADLEKRLGMPPLCSCTAEVFM